jgi:hypothetical protein
VGNICISTTDDSFNVVAMVSFPYRIKEMALYMQFPLGVDWYTTLSPIESGM